MRRKTSLMRSSSPSVGRLRDYIARRLASFQGTADPALLALCLAVGSRYRNETDPRTLALWWDLLRTARRHRPRPPRDRFEKLVCDLADLFRKENR